MFSSTSYPSTPGSHQNQEPNRDRTPFSHSYSQPFSVAGMSSPGTTHSPSIRAGPLSGGAAGSLAMGDSLSQSRVNYQAGYLMSVTQNNVSCGSIYPRVLLSLIKLCSISLLVDSVLTNPRLSQPRLKCIPYCQVQQPPTLAWVPCLKVHGKPSSYISLSTLFLNLEHRERQRQPLADEDAPPTNSVNDIVNEVYNDSGSSRRQFPVILLLLTPCLFWSDSPFPSNQWPSTPPPVLSFALHRPKHQQHQDRLVQLPTVQDRSA